MELFADDSVMEPWPEWTLADAEQAYRREGRRQPERSGWWWAGGFQAAEGSNPCRIGELYIGIGDKLRPLPRIIELPFVWGLTAWEHIRDACDQRDRSPKQHGTANALPIGDQLLFRLIDTARLHGCVTVQPTGQLLLGRHYTPGPQLNLLATRDLRATVACTPSPIVTIAAEGPLYRRWTINLAKAGNDALRLDAYPTSPAVPHKDVDWSA